MVNLDMQYDHLTSHILIETHYYKVYKHIAFNQVTTPNVFAKMS